MLQVNLIHWNPDGFKIGLCGTPPAGQPRALCEFTFCDDFAIVQVSTDRIECGIGSVSSQQLLYRKYFWILWGTISAIVQTQGNAPSLRQIYQRQVCTLMVGWWKNIYSNLLFESMILTWFSLSVVTTPRNTWMMLQRTVINLTHKLSIFLGKIVPFVLLVLTRNFSSVLFTNNNVDTVCAVQILINDYNALNSQEPSEEGPQRMTPLAWFIGWG